MRLPTSLSLDHIIQLLRHRYDEASTEPLPARWIELINYLNEKERVAANNASHAPLREHPEERVHVSECTALSGLTEDEVMAIAEHEHVGDIAAASIGRSLLKEPNGSEKIRDMMRDDIHDAFSRADKEHASELLMVLRRFLANHPAAQPSQR